MTRSGAAHQPGVLSIRPLRRLWIALSLSSLGDWLGLLALTAPAVALTAGDGFAMQSYAVAGVLLAWTLPRVLPDAPAAAPARSLDRRTVLLAADAVRAVLLVSVALLGQLVWLVVAALLTSFLGAVSRAAVDATAPGLVPQDRVEDARRAVRRTAYGAAPVASVLFALLALLAGAVLSGDARSDLPLYVTAAVFVLSAVAAFGLRPGPVAGPEAAPARQGKVSRAVPALRGLLVGLAGAFAAGGAVLGVARIHVATLHGGDAGFGAVFGAAFLGMAFGVFQGPRMLGPFSRRRLLGLSVVAAGVVLAAIALIHNLVVVVVLTAVLGWAAGVAWSTARTVVRDSAEEDLRGPAQAFLRSAVRVVLLVVTVAAPALAGVIGRHRLELGADSAYRFDGPNAVLLGVALLALVAGLVAYRRLDDRRGIPLVPDLGAALRGEVYTPPAAEPQTRRDRGVFIAFEGGEGAGKTTQARLTAIWLRDHGYDVVTTSEPGATKIGMRLRAILLDKETKDLSSRAETLLYAADRANHVANVIEPALARGAIVVSDRYVDSSLAYQGFGREQSADEIAELNRWATGGLLPDLTVLLDVPPETGFGRFASPADRMESEPLEFHERVRRGFRRLAEADPDRYLVIDASLPQEEITRLIRDRLHEILPDPVPAGTEDITSTFPAIAD
ncbi:dTMP kinase [Thermomonospora cellulosilytica]|uniref:Thymidylate kinase n=1 Tax=Thermomonospora cellulosilytica TaxID=1411118 RepID=A0A7W3R6D7_9ACTN|nr:dTMP kinase [Thermomonospora cellulosilytica]MBA9001532.1 dTMP kinase [Thermomonospora cellulosilytica]